jgi:hypothetical protein
MYERERGKQKEQQGSQGLLHYNNRIIDKDNKNMNTWWLLMIRFTHI